MWSDDTDDKLVELYQHRMSLILITERLSEMVGHYVDPDSVRRRLEYLAKAGRLRRRRVSARTTETDAHKAKVDQIMGAFRFDNEMSPEELAGEDQLMRRIAAEGYVKATAA